MPFLARLFVADVILLQPVEVVMLMALVALAIRHRDAVAAQVHAVSLGALQKGDVLQVFCRTRKAARTDCASWSGFGLHLLAVAPSADQVAGLFVDRGVDQMGDVGHLSEDFGAALAGRAGRRG